MNGADQLADQALAKVNRDGQLIVLTPSRDLAFPIARSAGKTDVSTRLHDWNRWPGCALQIVVNQLYADVAEGNLRHNITTRAEISIISQAANGKKQVKNYRSTYNIQGPLTKTNEKITNAVNTVLGDVINDMAQDTTVSSFIIRLTLDNLSRSLSSPPC
ncbi:MAG: YajG family lipoprotein [Candidatus Malihini olakiniferum]